MEKKKGWQCFLGERGVDGATRRSGKDDRFFKSDAGPDFKKGGRGSNQRLPGKARISKGGAGAIRVRSQPRYEGAAAENSFLHQLYRGKRVECPGCKVQAIFQQIGRSSATDDRVDR